MTESEVKQRLAELYPASDAQARQALAPVVVAFGCEDRIESEAVVSTLHEWQAVLSALGREGMTLAGMLDYEFREMPGVKLCRRVTDMTVREDRGGVPYLESRRSDEPEPIAGFVPVCSGVWLRESGRYAICDGVPLIFD